MKRSLAQTGRYDVASTLFKNGFLWAVLGMAFLFSGVVLASGQKMSKGVWTFIHGRHKKRIHSFLRITAHGIF
ncbi:MAG: hypothetical protein QMC17_08325 [Paracoccaceae bacterium]